jgi:uncharacterized repeat protein (TIGR03803 family)
MSTKLISSPLFLRFAPVILAILLLATSAQAGEKNIVSFNKTEGANPISAITADSNGNLYGTTSLGGAHNCGTVFQLSPSAGQWTATVLYSFTGCNKETMTPVGPLIFDKLGNLYGVIQGYYTYGWVFELSKGADGTWSELIIHTFKTNEGLPNPELTFDSSGNLYGTTQLDSTGFDGEVFELSPQGGSWKESVIYSFPAPNGLGFPTGGPIFDSKGNLYGVTWYGITGTYGAVYELSPQANSSWTLSVLSSGNTQEPASRLIFDSSGNLYGIMGSGNDGAIFKLSPTSGGSWTETTIHTFTSGTDGAFPVGPLLFDGSGNLYGGTSWGGTGCNQNLCGTVYRLTPQSGGAWKETILHYFESATDGSEPGGGVYLDSSGNLYGTTYHGGSRYGYGTVYEITP